MKLFKLNPKEVFDFGNFWLSELFKTFDVLFDVGFELLSLCDILRPCELVASSFELYFNIPGLILLELSFIVASRPVQIRLAHVASIQSGERAMVLADIVALMT